jgi:hypothetical protein
MQSYTVTAVRGAPVEFAANGPVDAASTTIPITRTGEVCSWPIATLPQEFMSAMSPKADKPEPTRRPEQTSRGQRDLDLPAAAVCHHHAIPLGRIDPELCRDLAHVEPARRSGQSSPDAFADPYQKVVRWMLFLWDLCSSQIGIVGHTASS